MHFSLKNVHVWEISKHEESAFESVGILFKELNNKIIEIKNKYLL